MLRYFVTEGGMPTHTEERREGSSQAGGAATVPSPMPADVSGALGSAGVAPLRLQPVRGVRDFYPAELSQRNRLFDCWRECAQRFGFEEYDACLLEHEALYLRKGGEEIGSQLYRFSDRSERRLALRPEMTPSLARMILQRHGSLSFPLKWFSIPQCFRYERMTQGRRREHYQWNADIIGLEGDEAEAELLCLLLSALEQLGFSAEELCLRLNDRRLLDALLAHLGVAEPQRVAAMIVLDKAEKLSAEALTQELQGVGIGAAQRDVLESLLQGNLEELDSLPQASVAIASLQRLQKRLERSGFGAYVRFDLSVVRGLAYYTGTVFEVRDRSGARRALCGGGRYDSLLSAYGGPALPAVGFGCGDVGIIDLLREQGSLDAPRPALDCVIAPYSPAEADCALEVAQVLRRAGYRVDTDWRYPRLGRALKRAAELGAKKAILILPEELKTASLILRHLDGTSAEERLPLRTLLDHPEQYFRAQ